MTTQQKTNVDNENTIKQNLKKKLISRNIYRVKIYKNELLPLRV